MLILIQHIFPSKELAPNQSTIVIRDFRFIYFHTSMKSDFLVSKGLLYLYDKQNNKWLLVDMEFLFSCSTRHLTRSLRSLVSYRVKYLKKKFHIYARPCIILYLLHMLQRKTINKFILKSLLDFTGLCSEERMMAG